MDQNMIKPLSSHGSEQVETLELTKLLFKQLAKINYEQTHDCLAFP